MVDYISGICYVSHILAHLRGRLRRRAEGGAGSGVLRLRLVTAVPREARDPARQAQRPGCEELAALIRRKCRRRKRGPRPKIATVERREASASRWTRAARQSARIVARRNARQQKTCAFRRSARPHGVDGTEEKQNPGAQTRRGNEGGCVMTGYELGPREATSVPPHPEEAAKPPSRRMGGHRSRVYPRSATLSAVPLMLRDAAQPSLRRLRKLACAAAPQHEGERAVRATRDANGRSA